MEPCSVAKGTGSHGPADGIEFIGESAFEGHHYVATLEHVVGQAVKEVVAGYIKRRNDHDSIFGEVRGFWKNKVDAYIRAVERAIHLAHNRDVIGMIAK